MLNNDTDVDIPNWLIAVTFVGVGALLGALIACYLFRRLRRVRTREAVKTSNDPAASSLPNVSLAMPLIEDDVTRAESKVWSWDVEMPNRQAVTNNSFNL